MLRPLARWALASLLLVGCDCSANPDRPPGTEGAPCAGDDECNAGLRCRDGVCTPLPDAAGFDAGGGADAGECPASRICGDACCAAGESCGGDRCCLPEERCGGICCGEDQTCEADRCVLECADDQVACGAGADAVCCASGDVCYFGECLTPGRACERSSECADGEYCEGTVMRCLPRAMGEDCEYRPETGDLELDEEWHWSGDADVLPSHHQIMMAPMVANLTDDDGDGDIDADDVPDVVFHSFTGSNYWSDGVLRAIRGSDGARLWPASDPGYRTSPGGELAIADVDPSSPGPEILACSPSDRASTPRQPGHLMLIAADGSLIRRFDTAPNDVPCGFDAPAVGDMNGDGIPEIVVRFVIAHADGTVVQRIRDLRGAGGPYNTLADVDPDPDLELVGSDGAYDYDGTPVWERVGELPSSRSIAVADLDLDGGPELVMIGDGHFIRAVSAETGADVWGPTDINPPELASVVAANGNPSGGGPPTIANFDDDPNPEIAFAGGFAYVIFGHDGSRQWYFETQDRSSRATGSSIFDFEGDGVAEVLYNDEVFFRVFRGPDGSVLYDECNTSGTLREFPIVVDVDNDDQAEIVLMENDYATSLVCPAGEGDNGHGIHVFGHPRGQWVRTRRIFNQHTYHVTNIEEDGTVPMRETRNWTVENLNNFRQNVQPEGLFDAPDAVLADLTASTRSCPTAIGLSVRVVNRGAAGMPAGIPVTFYRDEGGTRTLLGRATTTRPLLPGESELLELTPDFAVPAGMESEVFTFVAVVNDPDDMPVPTFNQCRTENDEAEAIEVVCPSIE
ncbi:MAG TPA: hypothetical protein RMH99_28975 [Sandaracinaceae bacterium LLY-WYZ-13_1]|nr:hypothetical protein [Sandaracinaceae bacterium LLY-WYZ-13_1]